MGRYVKQLTYTPGVCVMGESVSWSKEGVHCPYVFYGLWWLLWKTEKALHRISTEISTTSKTS